MKIQKNTAIVCYSSEESKELCEYLHEKGYTWKGGAPMTKDVWLLAAKLVYIMPELGTRAYKFLTNKIADKDFDYINFEDFKKCTDSE